MAVHGKRQGPCVASIQLTQRGPSRHEEEAVVSKLVLKVMWMLYLALCPCWGSDGSPPSQARACCSYARACCSYDQPWWHCVVLGGAACLLPERDRGDVRASGPDSLVMWLRTWPVPGTKRCEQRAV